MNTGMRKVASTVVAMLLVLSNSALSTPSVSGAASLEMPYAENGNTSSGSPRPTSQATRTSTIVEEFDSADGFTSTDPDVYIQDGKVHWHVSRSEGEQYVYRSIPSFAGDVRLTVTGQVDGATNNCGVRAGIGDGFGTGPAVDFGFYGGGCSTQGYVIRASGADLDYSESHCVFTGNWLWINSGNQYTATLTLEGDEAELSVPGIGSSSGTPTYDGVYNTLYVGTTGGGDWPSCWGTIERMVVEQISETTEHDVHLPVVMNNHIHYPPVNVGNHTTGADGLVTVPLTGGGTATFRLIDRLDQPVANISVVSIENEYGVTLLAAAQRQGFFPKVFSAPASGGQANGAIYRQATAVVVPIPLVPLNEEGTYAEETDLVYGHVLSLPQERPDEWVKRRERAEEVCQALGIAAHSFAIGVHIVSHGLTLTAGAVIHGTIIYAAEKACPNVLAPNPVQQHAVVQPRSFVAASRAASSQSPLFILDWEPSLANSNGMIYGQVLDAATGVGVPGVQVSLDGSAQSYTTLPNGWYRFEGVSCGTHSVEATRSGYTSDTVSGVLVSSNRTTQAPDLELDVISWGIWRIQNDTGGTLTIDIEDIGIQSLGPGTHNWLLLPGTYDFIAWTTACGGVVEDSVTIYPGYITSIRFYCGQALLEITSARIRSGDGYWEADYR